MLRAMASARKPGPSVDRKPRGKAGGSAPKKSPKSGGRSGGAGAARDEPLRLIAPEHKDAKSGGTARVYVGDCRAVVPRIPECAAGAVDLIFADPPFNWSRGYDLWNDRMPRNEYLDFTYAWLDACVGALAPKGSFWVNIPDDTAAEIVVYLKGKHRLEMVNWCVWHYRFGQNRLDAFINSKVHALYFARGKDPSARTWNLREVLEPSDRATTYFDPRTHNKKEGTNGLRAPMDVWYGKFWGRIQGNNKERRANHDNQLPEVYLERVIRACSNEGDVVMDPFNGSGTTLTVGCALGRRCIGVEYSEALAKSAWKRITRGPLRLGEGLNDSTAIFAPRRRGSGAAKKTEPRVASDSMAMT